MLLSKKPQGPNTRHSRPNAKTRPPNARPNADGIRFALGTQGLALRCLSRFQWNMFAGNDLQENES